MERKFNTIEEAAEALRQGQIIVVIDDRTGRMRET